MIIDMESSPLTRQSRKGIDLAGFYLMRNLGKHTTSIGIVLTVLFLAANAGLTFAVHYCSISGTTACSCPTSMQRQDAHRHVAAGTVISSLVRMCCRTFIAGGLNTAPTISERAASSAAMMTAVALATPLPLFSRLHPHSPSLLHFLTTQQAVPAQEKYVLSAAFLI